MNKLRLSRKCIHGIVALTFAVLLSGVAAGRADALILLSDNFNAENGGTGVLDYDSFTNWNVSDGTVDLIGVNSGFDFYPGNGLYVDLDGSSRNAGILTSKEVFNLDPGEYWLSFDLGGSTRGDTNTVMVSLGSLYNEEFQLGSSAPLSTVQRQIVVGSAATGAISFDHAGGDNLGLILDNVSLEKREGNAVPEPATLVLFGSGLFGAFVARRRKN